MNYIATKLENIKSIRGINSLDHFSIEIQSTTRCNYKCHYCTDLRINENYNVIFNKENVKNLLLSIKKIFNKKIHIFIYGGEPTLYPDLLNLINSITEVLENEDVIYIASNLSISEKRLIEFSNNIKHKKYVKFSVSYHSTECKDLKKLINKCLYLKQNNLLLDINVMYNSKINSLTTFNLLCLLFGKHMCNIEPLFNSRIDQSIVDNNNSHLEIDYIHDKFNIDQLEKLSKFTYSKNIIYSDYNDNTTYISRGELWHDRKNNFYGMSCEVSKWKLHIDWYGDTYSCFNQQFSNNKPLFNINETGIDYETILKNTKCIVCPFNICFHDIHIKKEFTNDSTKPMILNRFFGTKQYKTSRKTHVT
jgi:organic radical activating enzyme